MTILRILGGDPLPVGAAGDLFHPVFIFQIPFDGLAHTGLETLARLPSQFALDLARVDGIATVVAGTVLHKGD